MSTPPELRARIAAIRDERKSCSTDGRHVWFGVPADDLQGRVTLEDKLPANVEVLHFLDDDPAAPELIRAVLASPAAEQITGLCVGASDYRNAPHCDHTAAVAAVAGARLPRLTNLELGEWELFSNSGQMYGTIGDVTEILGAAPGLVALGLRGSFTLTRPVSLPRLVELDVWSETSVCECLGPEIDAGSMRNLLSTELPELKSLLLHPYCKPDELQDAFPPEFLDGSSVPNLTELELINEEMDAASMELILSSGLLERPGFALVFEHLPEGLDMETHRTRPGLRWHTNEWGTHNVRLES